MDCGECLGCCSSSYFIHVRPDENETIRRIGKEFLFPAPGLPKGHLLMGFDSDGLCPMLRDGQCTVYEQRPQTCRNYDCRVFAAAGIAAGGSEKAVINARVARWKFSYSDERDRSEHRAVQAAATFVCERADCFPGGRVPTDPSQLAILAIKVYGLFLERGLRHGSSDRALAEAIMESSRKFDATMTPC